MEKTKYFSYKNKDIPRGCKLCVKGRKLVVFITGVCSNNCFYCPLSDEKYKKDVIYANEMPIKDLKDIIKEAKLCSATGAGITGGDPLTRFERTIEVIKLLKKEFGKKFHIHLYTPLNHINEEKIKKLEKVGLDEIRFHPNVDDDSLWKKVELKTNIPKCVEIPVIPTKKEQTIKLIKYIKEHIDFLNLNELEYSDTKHTNLAELGFYGWNKYESTLLDTNTLGFVGVVDFVVHDMWSLRLASAYQRSSYVDSKLRYPFKGGWEQVIKGGLLDKAPFPETINLALNDLSVEFDVIFSPHDWHQFRLVVFGNYVSAFNEKILDYDYQEIGVSFYYQFAFPNNNFIRRKSRYGFFGLF